MDDNHQKRGREKHVTVVEFYSKKECSLCEEAKPIMRRVNEDFHFSVSETTLNPDDPRFSRYKDKFPVIRIPNGREISGKITEEQVRRLFLSMTPPPPLYYVAKFLEALAIVAVFFGFMYGLMGNMWLDLYFFLGGIGVFLAGWSLEKWESRSRKRPAAQP